MYVDMNKTIKVPHARLSELIHQITSLLPINDAIWNHDLCELSISLWEFVWGV